MSDQASYDLERLADALEKQGRHRQLTSAIRRGYDTASAATDLLKAEKYLALLLKLQTKGNMPDTFTGEEAGGLIDALFVTAVIVYARATVSDPIARKKWFGPDRLVTDQRAIHDAVIDLRNKEFAHFGKGMAIDGETLLAEALHFSPSSRSPVGF